MDDAPLVLVAIIDAIFIALILDDSGRSASVQFCGLLEETSSQSQRG